MGQLRDRPASDADLVREALLGAREPVVTVDGPAGRHEVDARPSDTDTAGLAAEAEQHLRPRP